MPKCAITNPELSRSSAYLLVEKAWGLSPIGYLGNSYPIGFGKFPRKDP